MKSDLDVWAIQKYKDETKKALENVKKDSLGNILYLNCICKFTIGKKKIENRTFDACFYSEESDTVIFFARDMISENEIEQYLEDAGVKYTIIRFLDRQENDYKNDDEFPEIWFARESYVLEDALDDSIKKGDTFCEYKPDIESSISLSYRDTQGEKHEIEGRLCKGMIMIGDKMILIIKQRDYRNMNEEDVRKVLDKKGIKYKQQFKK